MIICDKNSNHGILVDSVSVSTTKQVKTIYDMSKLKSLRSEGFSKNEWVLGRKNEVLVPFQAIFTVILSFSYY